MWCTVPHTGAQVHRWNKCLFRWIIPSELKLFLNILHKLYATQVLHTIFIESSPEHWQCAYKNKPGWFTSDPPKKLCVSFVINWAAHLYTNICARTDKCFYCSRNMLKICSQIKIAHRTKRLHHLSCSRTNVCNCAGILENVRVHLFAFGCATHRNKHLLRTLCTGCSTPVESYFLLI